MDDGCVRVQAHAAAAVINFCEHCEKETLNPYLQGLLGARRAAPRRAAPRRARAARRACRPPPTR